MNVQSPRKLIVLAFLTLFLLSPFNITITTGQTLPADLNGINVALYCGDPSTSTSSRTALQFMFSWMNASVDILYASDIHDGDLAGYDMIVIPGGWAGTYNEDLAGTGITEIRNFVRNGGAFFGVCAGAYFACDKLLWEGAILEYPMNLYEGYGIGPMEEIAAWPDYDMTDIIVNHSSSIINLSGEPENHTVMYYGGPGFDLTGQQAVHSIATYSTNNKSAMIAFEYEEGRVFLSGPHPEWEEDSQRDNVSWDNVFEDNGSEWDMMLKVSLWLLENSGFETTSTTSTNSDGPFSIDTIVIIGGISLGAIIVALVLIKRR
ncbi:MAG: BPL-N domain-containing protein [Candidatus Thorarchaeota archaeon]